MSMGIARMAAEVTHRMKPPASRPRSQLATQPLSWHLPRPHWRERYYRCLAHMGAVDE